jgi:hypothetical protein
LPDSDEWFGRTGIVGVAHGVMIAKLVWVIATCVQLVFVPCTVGVRARRKMDG